MCHHKKKWAQNNWPVATGCAGGCDNSKPIAEEKREKKKKEMFGISHSHLISHAGQSHNNKQPKFCIFCFLRGFSRYLRPAPWLTRLMAAGENYLVNLKEFRSDAKSKNLYVLVSINCVAVCQFLASQLCRNRRLCSYLLLHFELIHLHAGGLLTSL